jgi:hypothetical protein
MPDIEELRGRLQRTLASRLEEMHTTGAQLRKACECDGCVHNTVLALGRCAVALARDLLGTLEPESAEQAWAKAAELTSDSVASVSRPAERHVARTEALLRDLFLLGQLHGVRVEDWDSGLVMADDCASALYQSDYAEEYAGLPPETTERLPVPRRFRVAAGA